MTDKTTAERICLTCKERPSGRYYHCKQCRSEKDKVPCVCGGRKTRRAERCVNCRELWVTMQPAGQRVEDLIGYAREILARYEDVVD